MTRARTRQARTYWDTYYDPLVHVAAMDLEHFEHITGLRLMDGEGNLKKSDDMRQRNVGSVRRARFGQRRSKASSTHRVGHTSRGKKFSLAARCNGRRALLGLSMVNTCQLHK